jgi:hypothetical protein
MPSVLAQLQHGSRLSNGCFHESLFELGFAVTPAVSGVDFTVHQLSHDISRSGKFAPGDFDLLEE